MNILINPSRDQWPALTERPYTDNRAVMQTVRQILEQVKTGGDQALQALVQQLDGYTGELEVAGETIDAAEKALSEDLKAAIQTAIANVRTFHAAQCRQEEAVETMPGVRCWRRSVGIERVGLYIPGGTAPLFSTVIMLAVPAQLAGCREVILCTPAREGHIHPAILYAARQTGIQRIFAAGGAQAIAAMAYGTATIPAVSKIFGPGNQYVTAAKQLVQEEGVAIDMPAGPSEVAVYADHTAVPAYVAADLLSQAEHGADSQVVLVCTSEEKAKACMEEVNRQLPLLPRKEVASKALEKSRVVVMENEEEAMALLNAYAAEHLILSCEKAEAVAMKITNAGSVFLGHYSPESVGDYASGTNHTLPTNGFARAYSGVSVDSFVRKITYQQLTKEGLELLGSTVVTLAEAEGLQAHARAVKVRLEK